MNRPPLYQIEGNIDFYQSLQQEEEVDYSDTNKCLITHQPLDPTTAVTLECHHSFNYLPLFKYVRTSKSGKFTNLETARLKSSQLKCPFCRNVQNTLLPLPPPGVDAPPTHGVNMIEYSSAMTGTCHYTDRAGQPCPSTSVYLCYHDNQCYCFHHRYVMKKIWDKQAQQEKKPKCPYIFCRGIRQGAMCGKNVTNNIAGGLCSAHSKTKDPKHSKENK